MRAQVVGEERRAEQDRHSFDAGVVGCVGLGLEGDRLVIVDLSCRALYPNPLFVIVMLFSPAAERTNYLSSECARDVWTWLV